MTKTYFLYGKTVRNAEVWENLGIVNDLPKARDIVRKHVEVVTKGSRCLFRWTETNEYGCGPDPKHVYGRITDYALPQFGKWTDSGVPFTTDLASQSTIESAWKIQPALEQKSFEETIDWHKTDEK